MTPKQLIKGMRKAKACLRCRTKRSDWPAIEGASWCDGCATLLVEYCFQQMLEMAKKFSKPKKAGRR